MASAHPHIGIDLGGTKIEIIALNDTGDTLYRQRVATPKGSSPDDQYHNILIAIRQLVDNCEQQIGSSATSLGIGIPGAVSLTTGKVKNANTTCLIGKAFEQDLSNALNKTVIIENDANCFALSEAIDGAGRGATCVFGVILGTGVGGAMVLREQLWIGENAIAGEWGHNPLPWPTNQDEPKLECYCGKQGCIETYLSGPGNQRWQNQFFGQHRHSKDWFEFPHLEPATKQAYDLYVDRLARSLAHIINTLDPNVIVLGGGLSNIDSLYIDVPQRWGNYVFSDTVTTQLKQNEFGDSSGVRGAAWLTKSAR